MRQNIVRNNNMAKKRRRRIEYTVESKSLVVVSCRVIDNMNDDCLRPGQPNLNINSRINKNKLS